MQKQFSIQTDPNTVAVTEVRANSLEKLEKAQGKIRCVSRLQVRSKGEFELISTKLVSIRRSGWKGRRNRMVPHLERLGLVRFTLEQLWKLHR
ncbi:hypothetical protein Mapa_006878 [Marchantia paleacea]|nr:hypothetical protein Mapa_006878 [Marchantia paleacea]